MRLCGAVGVNVIHGLRIWSGRLTLFNLLLVDLRLVSSEAYSY